MFGPSLVGEEKRTWTQFLTGRWHGSKRWPNTLRIRKGGATASLSRTERNGGIHAETDLRIRGRVGSRPSAPHTPSGICCGDLVSLVDLELAPVRLGLRRPAPLRRLQAPGERPQSLLQLTAHAGERRQRAAAGLAPVVGIGGAPPALPAQHLLTHGCTVAACRHVGRLPSCTGLRRQAPSHARAPRSAGRRVGPRGSARSAARRSPGGARGERGAEGWRLA